MTPARGTLEWATWQAGMWAACAEEAGVDASMYLLMCGRPTKGMTGLYFQSVLAQMIDKKERIS